MIVYCSNCGLALNTARKAMPKYGRIIELIDPHVCSDKVQEFNLTPNPVPVYVDQPKGKFVEILNELQPSTALGAISTMDLRDRRQSADVRSDIDSTAPITLLDQLKQQKEPDQ